MNILNQYSRKSLKKNRTQTVVTIIGIAISMAMLTAVILGAHSGLNFIREIIEKSDGGYHGFYDGVAGEDLKEYKTNPDFEKVASWQELGWGQVSGSDSTYFNVYSIPDQEGSQAVQDLEGIRIMEGEMPKNDREILLPLSASKKDRGQYEVGSEISLDLGDRVDLKGKKVKMIDPRLLSEDGEVLETFQVHTQRTYKVSGFMSPLFYPPFNNEGDYCLTRGEGRGDYRIFFTFKNPAKMAQDYKNQDEGPTLNERLLKAYGVIADDGTRKTVYASALTMVLIIGIGAVFLISNSFSIALTERTQQYGMLSSIGATKKQIRSSIMTEGFYLGGLGTIFGLLIGWAGCTTYFWYLRTNAPDFSVYEYMPGRTVGLNVDLAPVPILIAVALCLLVTFISVRRPAQRASKLSPIEAIRQTGDIRLDISEKGEKKLERTALVNQNSGVEKVLAKKNFLRNKQRWKAPVRALALSIILFISAFSLIAVVDKNIDAEMMEHGDQDFRYLIYMNLDKEEEAGGEKDLSKKEDLKREMAHAEKMKEKFSQVKGVQSSQLTYSYAAELRIKKEDMDPDFLAYMEEIGQEKDGQYDFPIDLVFLEDKDFKTYMEDQGLDPSPYFESDQALGLAYNRHFMRLNDGKNGKKNVDQRVFREDRLPLDLAYMDHSKEEEQEYYPIQVKDTSREGVFGLLKDKPYIVYPMSRFWQVCQADEGVYFASIASSFNEGDYSKESLESLSEEDPSDHYFENSYEDRMVMRRFISMVKAFTWTFLVLIALVALVNMFNTITSNILLRRQEFAILVSIGMSKSQFMRMIRYEGWTYGLRSLIWSLPLASLASYGIHKANGVQFQLPWKALLISTAAALVMVFISIAYTVNKLDLDQPMEWTKGAVH